LTVLAGILIHNSKYKTPQLVAVGVLLLSRNENTESVMGTVAVSRYVKRKMKAIIRRKT
jgi:hypothetical protein